MRSSLTGRFLLCLILALNCGGVRAAIQSWEDADSIHLSNLDTPDESDAAPRVSLLDGAAGPGGDPDLRRLVAHDARTAEYLARYAPLVSLAARRHGIAPALLQAMVAVESAYNPGARSRRGAVGLMQVLPATAARFGVHDLTNPQENLRAGCLYLRELLQRFHENIALTVAAYNAGEHAVLQYGNRIPPYPETQRYVPQVVAIYQGLLH